MMQKRVANLLSIRRRQFKPLTAAQRRARLAQREKWLRQVDLLDSFNRLFDLIPGLFVFLKNTSSEIMFFSRSMLETFGITDDAAVIGLTDFELTPPKMSQGYREQDAAVLSTGEPILNRVELWFDRQGLPDWYVVNKLPLRTRTGKIIGVIGFLQRCQDNERLLPLLPTIARAAAYLREHFQEPVRIEELARKAGVSPRHMERQFKGVFGIGPHEFLVKTRVQAAARLLRETNLNLVEIAMDCGFCDQSALTRSFQRHMGITPTEFRHSVKAQSEDSARPGPAQKLPPKQDLTPA